MDGKSSLIEKIFNQAIAPAIVATLTPILSKLFTGDWGTWWNNFPTYGKAGFVALLVAWYLTIIVKRRIADVNNVFIPCYGTINTRTFQQIAAVPHAGANWSVYVPRQYRDSNGYLFTPIEDIVVAPTPRCPKCAMELEQCGSFWGGYNWVCVGCHWKRRRQNSFGVEAERAEIKARYWQEQRQEEWRQKGNTVPVLSNFKL